MAYLPLNIDVLGMNVLMAGAGTVAARKVTTLVDAGAVVRVIAPDADPEIVRLATAGKIILKYGPYETNDLNDSFLVIAATGDRELNRRIADEAHQRGLLVSVVSDPKAGNFIFPAVLRRGNLGVAVTTNGACPAYSSLVRDIIAGVIGDEYGAILETLAAEREKLLTEGRPNNYNIKILRARAAELLQELECKE